MSDRDRTQMAAGDPRSSTWRIRGNPRHGQSTLEYILILAAILVAVITAANLLMKPAVDKAMTDSSNTIKDATGKLKTGLGL